MQSNQASANVNALLLVESARNITKSATPLVLASTQSELVKGAGKRKKKKKR